MNEGKIPVYYMIRKGRQVFIKAKELSFYDFHILNNPYTHKDDFLKIAEEFGIKETDVDEA